MKADSQRRSWENCAWTQTSSGAIFTSTPTMTCCWTRALVFRLRLRKPGFSEKKSGPIAFTKARIFGEEIRLEVPQWWRFSGFLSYANQAGYGQGPITGGLFLGNDAANALTDTSKFAVTQDQRNSVHGRVRFQAPQRIWLALGGQYGSGLPADIGNAKPSDLLTEFGQQILDRVDFTRGRVKSNLSFDLAAGAEIVRKEHRSATLQIQVANLANRLNVINFASLFSGTGVAAPRSVSANAKFTF